MLYITNKKQLSADYTKWEKRKTPDRIDGKTYKTRTACFWFIEISKLLFIQLNLHDWLETFQKFRLDYVYH